MDQEQNPAPVQARASEIRAQGGALWRRATAQIVRIPVTARVLLGFLLLAGILMGVHTALAGKDASLRLKVQHGFRTAQFSMWIDGDLAYSGKLIGSPARKFGLLPSSIQGSLSETFPVPLDDHQVQCAIAAIDGELRENPI